jgi:hypothetical protein
MCVVWSEITTARREAAIEEDRGWGPTLLLCLAIVLAAATVVVARPLAADAAGRPHTHGHARSLSSVKATAGHRVRRVPHITPGDAQSPNWSGYVAYSPAGTSGFNKVSATWVQKAVTCPKNDAWTLFWVGFDGWPSNEPTADSSVEQGGTSAQCVKGVPHYNAFYEMWPTHAVVPQFPVEPGDHIAANVVYSDGQFLITVTDKTSKPVQTFTQNETCGTNLNCPRTSAEWIAESPSHFGTNKWFPLANYGAMDFANATATDAQGVSGPIQDSQWQDKAIERMIAGTKQALAKVTPLQTSNGTSSFTDMWKRR